jgi:deazaflavin-dependent oxidoreductase (nitroreductase family)
MPDKRAGWLRRFFDFGYQIGEAVTMWLVPKRGPGPIFRWLFRFPILLYRIGLGPMIGSQVLVLETNGRRTGRVHRTPLSYQFDPALDAYYVIAGWGGRTDWYRNLRANASVAVEVGRRRFSGLARPLSAEQVSTRFGRYVEGDRLTAASISRWMDDGEGLGTREALSAAFPMVELTPLEVADDDVSD